MTVPDAARADSPTPWAAPSPAGAVTGTITIPGSKSLSNRALILAAIAAGPSTLRGLLDSRDTRLMADALRGLGATISPAVAGEPVTVIPIQANAKRGEGKVPVEIDCGLAGTVMRFVPPVAVLAAGAVRFDGDPHARTRPMDTMLGALRDLGATITGDALPFVVHGEGGLRGGEVTLDASRSSQFVSGLLLAAASFDNGVTVRHAGAPMPSAPHVEMTVAMLRAAGVAVTESADTWRVEPGEIRVGTLDIEPDLSNATPFLAAAAITGGEVRMPGWPAHTTQPGAQFTAILAEFGAEVTVVPDSSAGGTLVVRGTGTLRGVDLDLRAVGELTPTIAALALFADSPSTLRGIGHLRGHETDRLAALVAEIGALGGRASETSDGITITPKALHSGIWRAYADHRMATAGAIVGLRVPGVAVDDIKSTAKTIPDFAAKWTALVGA